MRIHISHPNKIIKMRGKARETTTGRDSGDSEKSCSSTSREVIQRGSVNCLEGLEVEEVSIVNKRCQFVRRRSLTNIQIKNAGNQQKINQSRPLQKHTTNNILGISQQNGDPQTLHILRNTLKSKMLSGIDLSIISQSKNQSKLDTPQCKVPNEKQTQSSNSTNTFDKWSRSRKPPIKKQPSFSRIIDFSDHSIRDVSVNPCLNSFHQDSTLNDSAVAQRMGFKEFLSNSCKLLPSIHSAQRISPLNRNFSREKKNSAVKKIINMEKLFAQKGIPLLGSTIDTPSLANKKEILAQLFEKQKSMITFDKSLESVVRFQASLEQED